MVVDITDVHGERLYRERTYEEIETPSDLARARSEAPVVITCDEPPTVGPQDEVGE
ncbi:hypothetical protein ACIPJS_13975 [Streptomyces sp. NPDC086783]|uniref:hypothetical protein n=1 Tax=Streptomyces sp. NPDC086783 TaxID=3365758 RepID=UPI00381F8AAA